MPAIPLYLATLLIFLVLDSTMLSFVMQPLFQREIGDLLAPQVRLLPAALFFLGYVAGLTWLVTLPALRDGGAVMRQAAMLGAMAFGTFELSNYATLQDWTLTLVLLDTGWGAVVTALAAWGGLQVARALAQEKSG